MSRLFVNLQTLMCSSSCLESFCAVLWRGNSTSSYEVFNFLANKWNAITLISQKKNRVEKKKISGCFETLTKPTNALKDNVIVPLISTTVFRVFFMINTSLNLIVCVSYHSMCWSTAVMVAENGPLYSWITARMTFYQINNCLDCISNQIYVIVVENYYDFLPKSRTFLSDTRLSGSSVNKYVYFATWRTSCCWFYR